MPEVWQMTCAEFVGDHRVYDGDPGEEGAYLREFDRSSEHEIDFLTEGWLPRTLRRVPSVPGFYFADIKGRPGDVALIQQNPVDGEYDVVGGYVEETLWIAEPVRGQGLAPELVLEAAEKRDGVIDPVSYTSAGKGAHESAHRLAVQRALRAGHRVPPEVLEDYPEFAEAEAAPAFGPR